MDLLFHDFNIEGKEVWLYHLGKEEENKFLPLVIFPTGENFPNQWEEIAPLVIEKIEEGYCYPFILAAFSSPNWNKDYTPWEAAPLFKKEPPFSGEGKNTLKWIENTLIPLVQKQTKREYTFENTAFLGYSLSGLFALWAFFEGKLSGSVASCSASLWFDGWMEYIKNKELPLNSRIYLSLGKEEEKTRNPRMAQVGKITEKTASLLKDNGNVRETIFQWHQGGHFHQVPWRIAQGLLWLMKKE